MKCHFLERIFCWSIGLGLGLRSSLVNRYKNPRTIIAVIFFIWRACHFKKNWVFYNTTSKFQLLTVLKDGDARKKQ